MTLEPDEQAMKDKAIDVGKRRARLEESIQSWSERVDDIEKMLRYLRDAWQLTKDQEQELQKQLEATSQNRRATGS